MKAETSPIPVSQEKLINTGRDWSAKAKAHPELDEFGITPEYITEFDGDISTAEGFKTAEEVDKETAVLTGKKNDKNKECYKWIKTSLYHYEKVYPKKDSPERKLFPQDYSDANTNDTHTVAIMPDIIKLLNDNKDAIIKKGMKSEFIGQGETLLSGLNDIKAQHKKKMDDDELYTIQRRKALSKVYNKINEISKAGKLAHEGDNGIGDYFDSPWPSGSEKTPPPDDTQNPPADPNQPK